MQISLVELLLLLLLEVCIPTSSQLFLNHLECNSSPPSVYIGLRSFNASNLLYCMPMLLAKLFAIPLLALQLSLPLISAIFRGVFLQLLKNTAFLFSIRICFIYLNTFFVLFSSFWRNERCIKHMQKWY